VVFLWDPTKETEAPTEPPLHMLSRLNIVR
jgi:hypothetical protein